ncbi:MAG: transglycosylase SLT domain-containing protein [Candidatus Cloacimonetes bacterium]|nr:transglycosylase SLT domain-containing protein [Candidatus Cloacimonadota bacterium]
MKRKRKLVKWIFWILIILILIYNPLSARLMTLIVAKAHNLDTQLFYRLVAAESSFRTLAYSRNKAIGLGQVQVNTAKYIFPQYVEGMLWFPPTNLHISAIYFRYLLNKYRDNVSLSLAAYNWGEANVDRKIKEERIIIDSETNYRHLFRNVPETYFFIKKILE